MPIQTQAEANAYWAEHDVKKWVVEFTAGPRRRRRTGKAYVASRTAAGARRAGFAAMDLLGQTWARSASATVRLATADDLGCVRTSGGTPA